MLTCRSGIEPEPPTEVKGPNSTSMKKMIVACALLCSMVAAAQTRAERTPQERAKAATERMTKELGLDAQQSAKVEAINAKYAEESSARREQRKAENEARRQEAKARLQAHEADMKAVLTEEQYNKWVVLRDERKQRRKEEMKERRKKPH